MTQNALGRQFQSMVFHGTSPENAARIRREGPRNSPTGRLGAGFYVSPEVGAASLYANSDPTDPARTSFGRVRKAKVVGFQAKGSPLRSDTRGTSSSEERAYEAGQLTPVHVQNSYPTSGIRASQRRMGIPPLPDTGPPRVSPAPVSQWPKFEITRRLAARRGSGLWEM